MKPQDFFGASPKTVLANPFMHVQDQKAYNVDGGSSIADAWTKRTLNTVIHNDIQGASLANDAVSLPAGIYYVEGLSQHRYPPGLSSAVIAIFKDGVKDKQSLTFDIQSNATTPIPVSGMMVLSASGVIDLRYMVGVGEATYGLGASNAIGSITDPSIPSIYADLKIWQLSGSIEYA